MTAWRRHSFSYAVRQAAGWPDVSGRWHHKNTVLWKALLDGDQAVGLAAN